MPAESVREDIGHVAGDRHVFLIQLLSALKVALDPTAGPLLIIGGAKLAALVVTSGVSGGDSALEERSHPSYAEAAFYGWLPDVEVLGGEG